MESLNNSKQEKQHQETLDEFFVKLPIEAAQLLVELNNEINQIESFDLLANISMYNHLHDTSNYSDDRGDKMFTISELVALIALKGKYINKSSIKSGELFFKLRKIQDLAFRYFGIMTMLQMKASNPRSDYSISGIAFKTMREEIAVRNPALPEHHLEISDELYKPLNFEIKKRFGFSTNDSIQIRKAITELINKKINNARDEAEKESYKLAKIVFEYRAKKVVPSECTIPEQNLIELNQYSRKEIKEICYNHCMNDLYFSLGKLYSLSICELTEPEEHAYGCTNFNRASAFSNQTHVQFR